jgi:hypothetical protein
MADMQSLHLAFLNAPSPSNAFEEDVSSNVQAAAAPVTSVSVAVAFNGFQKLR